MKFGLFTCPYQRLSLEKAFADAAGFGYDYIELWGGRPHAYAPDLMAGELDTVRRLIDRYAVPVRIYTPEHNAYPFNYMQGTKRQWQDSVDYLTLSLSCAKALGADAMLMSVGHSGFAPEGEKRARLLRSLRNMAAQAERLCQPIVLEPLTPFESDTCTRLSELAEVLEAVDSPYLRGMCDVVPPFVQGEVIADYPRLLGERMAHLHLVDSDGVSDTHLLPGEGKIDLKETIHELCAAGYDGTATLELVTHYIDTPSEAARLALERIRELL